MSAKRRQTLWVTLAVATALAALGAGQAGAYYTEWADRFVVGT